MVHVRSRACEGRRLDDTTPQHEVQVQLWVCCPEQQCSDTEDRLGHQYAAFYVRMLPQQLREQPEGARGRTALVYTLGVLLNLLLNQWIESEFRHSHRSASWFCQNI